MPAAKPTARRPKRIIPTLTDEAIAALRGPSGALRSYQLTYTGQGLSSNKWYAGMHWAKRAELKAEWRAKFRPLIIAADVLWMNRFRVQLTYCSRLDSDNCTAMIKLLIDQLKGWFVPEDSPKYFRGFSVDYDECLPHNTYVFTLQEVA